MGSSSHEGRLFDKTTPRPLCTKGINKHSRVTKDKRERIFSVASREDESNKMWCAFSGTKERKPRLVGESSDGPFFHRNFGTTHNEQRFPNEQNVTV